MHWRSCIGEVASKKFYWRSFIGEVAMEKLHQKSCIGEVVSEKIHWRSCMGEVSFGVGAESMAASQPHGVMAPKSSAS